MLMRMDRIHYPRNAKFLMPVAVDLKSNQKTKINNNNNKLQNNNFVRAHK